MRPARRIVVSIQWVTNGHSSVRGAVWLSLPRGYAVQFVPRGTNCAVVPVQPPAARRARRNDNSRQTTAPPRTRRTRRASTRDRPPGRRRSRPGRSPSSRARGTRGAPSRCSRSRPADHRPTRCTCASATHRAACATSRRGCARSVPAIRIRPERSSKRGRASASCSRTARRTVGAVGQLPAAADDSVRSD